MTIQKRFFVFLILSCFLFAAVFSVSGCGALASLVTTAASSSLGGMEAWVFVPAAGARSTSNHTPKVSPPPGYVALSGATLTIVGGSSKGTDSSGYASITGLASGAYTVTVGADGYKTFSYTVTVATGEDTVVGGSSGIQTEVSTAPGIMNLSATSGGIGDSVTITGVNFGSTQGTSTVKFNGTSATSITSWSSSQIVCVIPNSATTGNVVVTVGSESSNSISFTVSGSAYSWHTVAAVTGQTLNSVYGTSNGANVLAVGTSSTILAYQTSTGIWSEKKSGSFYAFKGVWSTSNGSNAFAVGGSGNIWTSSGGAWSSMNVATITGNNGVWGTSATNVFSVGNNGIVLHYAGSEPWHESPSETVNDLNGVWGSSSANVFAVGNSGLILRSTDNGESWTKTTPVADRTILGIWGTSDGKNIFVVYQNDGRILRSTDNFTTWTEWAPAVAGVTDQLNGVWGSSSSDVFVVGNNGTILHYDGASWSKMILPFGTTENLLGVWGSSSSDVYAVGASGKILHYGTN